MSSLCWLKPRCGPHSDTQTHTDTHCRRCPVCAELLDDIQTQTCSNIVYTMLLPWRHDIGGSPVWSRSATRLELWVLMMRSSRSDSLPPVWVVYHCCSTLLLLLLLLLTFFNNTKNNLKAQWGNTKHSPGGLALWFCSLTLLNVIKTNPGHDHYLLSNLCCFCLL